MTGRLAEPKPEETLVGGVDERSSDYDDEVLDIGSDDGSSSSSSSFSTTVPSKSSFYHPLPSSAQSGFVVKIDSKCVYAYSVNLIQPLS